MVAGDQVQAEAGVPKVPRGHIIDHEEYRRVRADAIELILAGKAYPDYVFSRQFKYHYFLETPGALDAAFLSTLGAAANDSEIFLVSVMPDAESFWLKEAGHRGAMRMSPYDIFRDWSAALRYSTGIITLDNIPNEQVIFSENKHWVAYVDMAWDLAVLGIVTDIGRMKIAGIQFIHDATWAEKYWRTIGSKMDDEFYKRLKANYPNPASNGWGRAS